MHKEEEKLSDAIGDISRVSMPLTPLEKMGEATSRYENDFEELDKIGEGGFGEVFKARHRIDGNIYAIKKIKLQSKPNSEENKRIRREVTYLSALNN